MVAILNLYTVLKFLHILLAIVAIGFNISYGIWLARARRHPEHLGHTLLGIKLLDDRFANPAYVLLLLSGLGMVFVGEIPLTTLWIASALVLWLILLALGAGLYTPTLRAQIRALEASGPDSPEYRRLARRGTGLGIALAVLVLVIVALMVFKPTLVS
jgi:uncharacterized membrane protein